MQFFHPPSLATAIQIQYKYNTNTVSMIHKYNVFTLQIQPQVAKMHEANFLLNPVRDKRPRAVLMRKVPI